jgi:putative membrane protein
MKNIGLVIFALITLGCQSCSSDDNDEETKVKPAPKPMVIIDKDAELFISKATSMGLYEIYIDRLAIKQGKDKRVKNFGNIMAKEHIKAIARLTEIANIKKIPVPATVTPEEQKEIDQLLKNNGKAFDRAYIRKFFFYKNN